MIKRFSSLALSALLVISCEKPPFEVDSRDDAKPLEYLHSDPHKLAFATILSKAIVENSDLRRFLKNEALQMKDNDFNVIYALCKDEQLNGKTFRELLIEYEEYEGQINEIESHEPTISILIPSLRSDGFSASSWRTDSEIPFVASENKHRIPVLYGGEEVALLGHNDIPASPTILVKTNERIKVTSPKTMGIRTLSASSIEFVHENFNNLNSSNVIATTSGTSVRELKDNNTNLLDQQKMARPPRPPQWVDIPYSNRNEFDFEVSQKIVDAFNEFPPQNGGWQRDKIYYDLSNTPDAKGPLDRTFQEAITAIKIKESGLQLMMDQDDPRYLNEDSFDSNTPGRNSRGPGKFWTDGSFEIQIDVLINDLSGGGPVYSTVLPVPGDQLFGAEYSQRVSGGGGRGTPQFYLRRLKRLVPKYYYCNIPIKEWDLENMGATWKISVRENDDQTVVNVQETHTSKFATNFGVDVSFGIEKVKIGLKFGGSAENTETQQISVQRTLTNDFLGDAIINFWDPVLQTNDPVASNHHSFLVDLKSKARRESATGYINEVNYNPQARGDYWYTDEQSLVKQNAQNRYSIESFYPVSNNNFEILMMPVYKY